MKSIKYENIELFEIFDEIDSPLFFSFKLNDSINEMKKNDIFISVFADYDLENEIDIFLTVPILKKEYDNLINGKDQIRSYFSNAKNKFLIKDFFGEFEVAPVNPNKITEYYPDEAVYLNSSKGEFYYIDKNEIYAEVEELKPLEVIETSKISNFIKKPELGKDYWYVSFGNNYKNLTSDALGHLLTSITRIKDVVSKNEFNLYARPSFEGSYGISFEVDQDIQISENSLLKDIKEINSLFTIINDKEYKNNPELLARNFGVKITKPFQEFIALLIDNDLDFKSLYIDREKHISAGYINVDTIKELSSVIDMEKVIEKKTVKLEGKITKIDVKNKSFGFISDFGYIKGKISDQLINSYENGWIDFLIGDVKEAKLTKSIVTKGFDTEEKISFTLVDLKYPEILENEPLR